MHLDSPFCQRGNEYAESHHAPFSADEPGRTLKRLQMQGARPLFGGITAADAAP